MTAVPFGAALLVIDVQRGLTEERFGQRSTPDAEANIARLLAGWRAAGWPVVHVHHHSASPESPLRPGTPGAAVKPEAAPAEGETVVTKSANCAFVGTDLEARLRGRGVTALVLVGLTTDHCVSSTARLAADLGFETAVVHDATAAFELTTHDGRQVLADEVHAVSLVTLKDEFAAIVSTDDALAAAGA